MERTSDWLAVAAISAAGCCLSNVTGAVSVLLAAPKQGQRMLHAAAAGCSSLEDPHVAHFPILPNTQCHQFDKMMI